MYLNVLLFTWQGFACANILSCFLCSDFCTHLLMSLAGSPFLNSTPAFSSSRPSSCWQVNLASCFAIGSKVREGKKIICRFYMALFFHTFFKDNFSRSYFWCRSCSCCRSYSFCRSYSKVSLLSAKKYAHKLITELYTAIQNLQLAFADGSTDAALCISQCMDRVFLNSSLLLLLISKFCSHCMSFNTLLSSKWFYLNSPGNISHTCRN